MVSTSRLRRFFDHSLLAAVCGAAVGAVLTVVLQTPSVAAASAVPVSGTVYLTEQEVVAVLPEVSVRSDVGVLDNVERWNTCTTWFDKDFKNEVTAWKSNESFLRFERIISAPTEPMELHLSKTIRDEILGGLRDEWKPYVAVFPLKRQISLVVLTLTGDVRSVTLIPGGKDAWADELKRLTREPVSFAAHKGQCIVCMAEGERLVVETSAGTFDLHLTTVWNPLTKWRSPEHHLDIVRVDWNRID